MVWSLMSSRGLGELAFVEGTMNTDKYLKHMDECMLPSKKKLFGRRRVWMYQQKRPVPCIQKSPGMVSKAPHSSGKMACAFTRHESYRRSMGCTNSVQPNNFFCFLQKTKCLQFWRICKKGYYFLMPHCRCFFTIETCFLT